MTKQEQSKLKIEFIFLGNGRYNVTTFCNGVKCVGILREVKRKK